jgi:hypothetical protein
MSLNFNPFTTTNQVGSFSVQSDGYIQGMIMSDPSIRNELSGGNYATGQTLPMFGGVAIQELINASSVLGPNIKYSTTVTNITGFSVFDQATSWVNTPQSPVPTASPGQTVSFFRLGSGIRVPLAIDPSLISLSGGLITQQVSWDFNNQFITAYQASTGTVTISSMTATTAGTVCTIAVVCSAASNVGAVGDVINISGATNAGTGGNTLVNGDFTVTAFTDNEHFSIQVPVSGSGVITTIGGSPVLNQGGGALPVDILDIQVGNSMVVVYNALTGAVTWNKQGSCALVKL